MRVGRTGIAADDEGSILPLMLGYAVLAIAVIVACVCATDLYIAQKRLDSLADAAALAGSDGFTLVIEGESVRAELTTAGVREQAEAVVAAMPGVAALVSADAPDGVTARVTVAAAWHPPLFSPFVPAGVALEASATSRTALQ